MSVQVCSECDRTTEPNEVTCAECEALANPQGFFDDIPEAEYHAHEGSLSVSGAKTLLKAPALYLWQQSHPVESPAFDLGSAAHKLVLGVGQEIAVCDRDDKRGNEWKAHEEAARLAGQIPLTRKEYAQVQAMADKLSENTLAMQLLSDGRPEVSAFALHERTGVMRRSRFDWLGPNYIVDLKTTVSANPADFGSTAVRFGYTMQAAWYLSVARHLGENIDAFAFVLMEKEPPYLVSVVELDDEALAHGTARNERALEMFRDCTASGIWPGYQPEGGFTTVSIPAWASRESVPG